MICNMCGSTNEVGAKFCSRCGHDLQNKDNKIEDNVHNSVIRRSIKKDAKLKNKRALYGTVTLLIGIPIVICAVYFFVVLFPLMQNVVPSFGTILSSSLIFFLLILVYVIISIFLNFGIVKSSLDISRDKQVTLKDVLNSSFKNISACLKIFALTFIMNVIIGILAIIPIIGLIADIALVVYFIPVITMVTFMLADNPNDNMSLTDLVKKGMEIIKNHRIEFYGLILSFAGWFILSIFTAGLLMIWLMPYMNVSLANLYRRLTKETKFEDSSEGLSNGAIIGITAILYVLFFASIIIILIKYAIPQIEKNEDKEIQIYDDFDYNYDYDYDYDDTLDEEEDYSKNIQIISGLNIYIPDGYSRTTVDGYDEAYQSLYGDVIIGVITQKIGSHTNLSDFTSNYKSIMNDNYTCGISTNKKLNGTDWEIFDCGDDSITLTNYMTLRDNKIYAVIVTHIKSSSSEVNDELEIIEDNLSFVY